MSQLPLLVSLLLSGCGVAAEPPVADPPVADPPVVDVPDAEVAQVPRMRFAHPGRPSGITLAEDGGCGIRGDGWGCATYHLVEDGSFSVTGRKDGTAIAAAGRIDAAVARAAFDAVEQSDLPAALDAVPSLPCTAPADGTDLQMVLFTPGKPTAAIISCKLGYGPFISRPEAPFPALSAALSAMRVAGEPLEARDGPAPTTIVLDTTGGCARLQRCATTTLSPDGSYVHVVKDREKTRREGRIDADLAKRLFAAAAAMDARAVSRTMPPGFSGASMDLTDVRLELAYPGSKPVVIEKRDRLMLPDVPLFGLLAPVLSAVDEATRPAR
ncbi:MAG: hypothetical protein H6737_08555 [Alphaproteobacteria bacterium]|nr:hypothetical protein [Alphaproteobacteria bacterium]